MLVQWLFNGCSMVVQWLAKGWRKVGERLAKGCHHALRPPFSASSMNADAAAVYVSSPMSFCFLVVENRVYLGGCFSWKAWQRGCVKMHILDTPSKVRQGGCLAVFRDVFSSTVKALTERFLS